MKIIKENINEKLRVRRLDDSIESINEDSNMPKYHLVYTVDGNKSEQTISAVNIQKAMELIKSQFEGNNVNFISKQEVKEDFNPIDDMDAQSAYDSLKPGDKFKNRLGTIITIVEPTKDGRIQYKVGDEVRIGSERSIKNMLYKNNYIELYEQKENLEEKFGKQEQYDLEQILDFTENNIKIWKKLLSKKSYNEIDTGYFDSLYDDFKHTFDKIKDICYKVDSERFSDLKNESLNEDVESPEKVIENEEKVPQTDEEVGLANMIIKEINGEWETISNYNDLISLMRSEGQDDMIDVISDIVDEENKHVGQLQKCLQIISPNVSEIDSGESEAVDQLSAEEQLIASSEECIDCADDDFGENSGFEMYLV